MYFVDERWRLEAKSNPVGDNDRRVQCGENRRVTPNSPNLRLPPPTTMRTSVLCRLLLQLLVLLPLGILAAKDSKKDNKSARNITIDRVRWQLRHVFLRITMYWRYRIARELTDTLYLSSIYRPRPAKSMVGFWSWCLHCTYQKLETFVRLRS